MATQATTEPGMESGSSANNSWKSKLTQGQLQKKRVADRRSHRQFRSKTKETVAALEERLRLLATPDRFIVSLMGSNAGLQAQRDNLQHTLEVFFAAFGFEKAEARDIMARVLRRREDAAHASKTHLVTASALPSPCSSSPNGSWQRSSVEAEIDSRLKVHCKPSPFPRIGREIKNGSQSMVVTDEQILAAIPKWRKTFETDGSASVFKLACELVYSDLPPNEIRDEEALERVIRRPDFFYAMLAELLSCSVEDIKPPEVVCQHTLLDVISRKRRELIALSVESTRAWRYNSPTERVVMFWGVYRFLAFLVFPTPQNLSRCPPWYRPIPSQFVHPHPGWADFIPWPYMRDRLVHVYRDYHDTDLMSSMLGCLFFDVKLNKPLSSLITVNKDGTDLVLDPGFNSAIFDVENMAVKSKFLDTFPEFEIFIKRAEQLSANSSPTEATDQLPELPAPDEGMAPDIYQWIEGSPHPLTLAQNSVQDHNMDALIAMDAQGAPDEVHQEQGIIELPQVTRFDCARPWPPIRALFLEEAFDFTMPYANTAADPFAA